MKKESRHGIGLLTWWREAEFSVYAELKNYLLTLIFTQILRNMVESMGLKTVSKQSPDFNFYWNSTKYGRICVYPMKYPATKFELDWFCTFWVIRVRRCTDRNREGLKGGKKLFTITFSFRRVLIMSAIKPKSLIYNLWKLGFLIFFLHAKYDLDLSPNLIICSFHQALPT